MKDATAAQMELANGLNSPQRICAERGRDYFEIIDEIAEAREYALQKRVPLEAVPLSVTINADATADGSTSTEGRVLPLRREVA